MATITFDTLKFVERLKAAGVPEGQAKAEAEALIDALSESTSLTLATKTGYYRATHGTAGAEGRSHQMDDGSFDRSGCGYRHIS